MDRKTTILFIAIFLIPLFIQFGISSFRNFENDDAYVTFVYAKNIADGYGFSYNSGEPSSGSTFLWPVVMAGAYFVAGDSLPITAKVISLMLSWVAIFMTFMIVRKMTNNDKISILSALLVAIDPWINMWSAASADTMLFTALSMTSIYFYISGKEKSSVLFSAFSYMARYEGGFLFIIIIAHMIFKDILGKKTISIIALRQAKFILIFLIGASAYVLTMLIDQGTILSSAFSTKRLMYEYFASSIGPLKFSSSFVLEMISMMPIFFGLFATALVSKMNLKSLHGDEIILYAWPVLFSLTHVFISYSATAYRYIVPVIPPIIISVMIFLLEIKKVKINILKNMAVIFILLALFQFAVLSSKMESIEGDSLSHFQISAWIEENLPEDSNIAIGELGIIKWVTNRYYYDVAGLVDQTVGVDTPSFVNYLIDNNVKYVINPVKYSSENRGDSRVSEKFGLLTLEYSLNFSGVEWGVYTTENLTSA